VKAGGVLTRRTAAAAGVVIDAKVIYESYTIMMNLEKRTRNLRLRHHKDEGGKLRGKVLKV
jgi:HAMP domain-containing protein